MVVALWMNRSSLKGLPNILILLCLFVITDAQPKQFNGVYNFECSNASLTLTLLLAGGNGSTKDANGGSQTIPIYCGPDPPPPSAPTRVQEAWMAYQLRLETAELDFANTCNTLVANLQLPPRPNDCSDAAAQWRQGLEELNVNVAGLAPASVSISVIPGGWHNHLFNAWSTYTTVHLSNGRWLPVSYNIDRSGRIWTLSLDGAASIHTESAGCVGGLAVASEGRLYSSSSSWIVNNYGGLLTCGVQAGTNLWIAIAAGIGVRARVMGSDQQ